MTQKTILFISDNFSPIVGGTPTVYHQICSRNSELVYGLSSTHTMGAEKAGWREYDARCGYAMQRLKYLKSPERAASGERLIGLMSGILYEVGFAAIIFLTLAQIFWKKKITSVCIGELVYCGWIGLVCKYIFCKKLILYCHGEELTIAHNTRAGSLRQIVLQKADIIIAVSRFCSDAIVSKYGINPVKIKILTNGVSLEDFYLPDTAKQNLKNSGYENKKIILAAGRHVPRKGFDALINALPALIQRMPNVHLIVLGEGPETNNLISLANTLNMSAHVEFKGKVSASSLRHHYQMADVFVMPNRTMPDGDTEGFGLVFLEANACGTISAGGTAGGAIEAIKLAYQAIALNMREPIPGKKVQTSFATLS